jgi:hypothetical protein
MGTVNKLLIEIDGTPMVRRVVETAVGGGHAVVRPWIGARLQSRKFLQFEALANSGQAESVGASDHLGKFLFVVCNRRFNYRRHKVLTKPVVR